MNLKKRWTLPAWVLLCVFLFHPSVAVAAVCFVDTSGGKYSVELGRSGGSKIELFGYRLGPPTCLPSVAGIAPLVGSVVVINSTTAETGWQVHSVSPGCVSFRENYTVNLTTLVLTGNWRNDAGVEGSDTLTPTTCPSPAEVGPGALEQIGKERAR